MPRQPTPPEPPAQHEEPPGEPEAGPEADDVAPPVLAKGTQDLADRVPREIVVDPTPAPRTRIDPDERALIAHDIRAPLAIILLEAEVLGARAHGERTRRSVDRIAHNVRYIERLVGDLLDFGALGYGDLRLARAPLDLAALVTEVVERGVPARDAGRVSVRTCAQAIVHGDRSRLERVVSNLLDNALKYGGSEAPVTVTLEIVRGRARLVVADRGPGLAPDEARAVFGLHRRGDSASGHPGHGLGLYVCRKVVDAHGGRIGVISAPGHGAQFFVELDVELDVQP